MLYDVTKCFVAEREEEERLKKEKEEAEKKEHEERMRILNEQEQKKKEKEAEVERKLERERQKLLEKWVVLSHVLLLILLWCFSRPTAKWGQRDRRDDNDRVSWRNKEDTSDRAPPRRTVKDDDGFDWRRGDRGEDREKQRPSDSWRRPQPRDSWVLTFLFPDFNLTSYYSTLGLPHADHGVEILHPGTEAQLVTSTGLLETSALYQGWFETSALN